MRFLLDSDVDVAVTLVVRSMRHDCWTAADAGLVGRIAAGDEEMAAYATAHDAAIVSHERGPRDVAARRVWLHAPQPEAADLVRHHLDDVVTALRDGHAIVVVSWPEGVTTVEPHSQETPSTSPGSAQAGRRASPP